MAYPNQDELLEVGVAISMALEPVRQRFPGLETITAYAVPRAGATGRFATSISTSVVDLQEALRIVMHAAAQLQDPTCFVVPSGATKTH